ncbi:MAG: c-type cytochrome [Candidatus Acidiferrales bacterium]
MWKVFLALPALVLLGFAGSLQETQKPADAKPAASDAIPQEAVQKENPVKPTPDSLALGKKYYGYDCAMCHGKTGDGQGDLGVEMKLKMQDFRDPAAMKGRTDGELYYLIQKGKGDMPPEGDRAKPEELWNLVNYVRSLAVKGFVAKAPAATP